MKRVLAGAGFGPATGQRMLLTFDKGVAPDDGGEIVGFSIADKSGKFYMAQAGGGFGVRP